MDRLLARRRAEARAVLIIIIIVVVVVVLWMLDSMNDDFDVFHFHGYFFMGASSIRGSTFLLLSIKEGS
jgi:hypothetical protein